MSKLDYKDVSLVPRVVSTLKSRSEANTGIDCFGIHLDVPMIASPMPDVCNGEMALKLAKLGALGIIHRFQTIDEQAEQYNYRTIVNRDMTGEPFEPITNNIACAIGIAGDYKDRYSALYAAGCRIFCLDTANGFHATVKEAIEWIRDFKSKENSSELIFIIAGNVATAEGYKYLADLGVDAVRVGIAGGCFTPEMEVSTSNGNKKIKDMQIGDTVISHDGSKNSVENIFEFDRDEEIISINGIECTKNHEFYVIESINESVITDDNIHKFARWIKAEDLNENYMLISV